jgi:transcriptional regulator with XRE-family HTH domain
LTQTECARRAGVTKAQLSLYETDRVPPMLDSLDRILRALDVGPGEFFALVAALDRLVVGEESMESIQRGVLDGQRLVLEEFLGGVARARLQGCPDTPLRRAGGRRSSVWSKILLRTTPQSPAGQSGPL